jgi:DNA-binding HxlR family transcriptional regulator
MGNVHGNTMVTDDEILAAFGEIPGPYVTATELEDVLPIGRKAITPRLKQLHEDGRIEKKQPVPQFVGWWRVEAQAQEDAPEPPAED